MSAQTLAQEAAALGTTLVEWLRTLAGYPGDTATFSDLACNIALRGAMQRINALDPLLGIGSFNTTAGTQSYSPTVPNNGYSIRQAWWPNHNGEAAADCAWDPITGQPWTWGLSAAFGQPIDELGTYTTVDPGIVDNVLRSRQTVERMIGIGSATVNNGATVYLTPVPEHTGVSVYFSFTAPRFTAPGDVTAPYFDAFWAAALASLLGAFSTGGGSVREVSDSQEGTRIVLDAGSRAAEQAATYERRFLRAIAVPPVADWLFGGLS